MLMLSLYCKARALWATRDRGASSVEYALLVFAIAAVIAATVFVFGDKLSSIFSDTCQKVNNNNSCATSGSGG